MAPSERELSAKVTEGECVPLLLLPPLTRSPSLNEGGFWLIPPLSRATFLREGGFWLISPLTRAAILREGGFSLAPIIIKIGRENNISAEICEHSYENPHSLLFR